jgi:hypothetical protein
MTSGFPYIGKVDVAGSGRLQSGESGVAECGVWQKIQIWSVPSLASGWALIMLLDWLLRLCLLSSPGTPSKGIAKDTAALIQAKIVREKNTLRNIINFLKGTAVKRRL